LLNSYGVKEHEPPHGGEKGFKMKKEKFCGGTLERVHRDFIKINYKEN